MRRREFIVLGGSAAVGWPLVASAQQADRVRRLGVLMAVAESDAAVRAGVSVFEQSLQELGWKDGNMQINQPKFLTRDELRSAATAPSVRKCG
jgi:putative ABC transport system substrate-binding protein